MITSTLRPPVLSKNSVLGIWHVTKMFSQREKHGIEGANIVKIWGARRGLLEEVIWNPGLAVPIASFIPTHHITSCSLDSRHTGLVAILWTHRDVPTRVSALAVPSPKTLSSPLSIFSKFPHLPSSFASSIQPLNEACYPLIYHVHHHEACITLSIVLKMVACLTIFPSSQNPKFSFPCCELL